MSARAAAPLYTPEILALAVALADFPLDDALPVRGQAVSRVCGSRLILGLALDSEGRIAKAGARVTACAIGQAAAAVFLGGATGRSAQAIGDACKSLQAWLQGEPVPPHWPGIGALAPARAYPARQAAILLPWKAAAEALSNRVRGA
ncbi:iron-sulfur cluster assembly scaffold protein [Qipengyuania sediminis]|uniref:iron-sulfur cluster assembly scaffold protein n=1 Tax=Qipengyuania sediminis TaxID=1532023 RepID=UPI00197FE673|nr:iron-sulfur cluster assembly scaffold protein [Qipengyuania sediminis]